MTQLVHATASLAVAAATARSIIEQCCFNELQTLDINMAPIISFFLLSSLFLTEFLGKSYFQPAIDRHPRGLFRRHP
ncbi:MAG: hypothetical protein J6Y54_02180 [Lentisphaeria bacterium]|nr:hypothetical protein [Lentisphaeria bacterium]